MSNPSDRYWSSVTSKASETSWGFATGGMMLSMMVLLISGLIVWPTFFFAVLGRNTSVFRLPDQPIVREKEQYKMNYRFGFRDDWGAIHVLYDEWRIVDRKTNRDSFESTGRRAYRDSGEVQFVPWCPWIRRPAPGKAFMDSEGIGTNPVSLFDACFVLQLLSLSYLAGYGLIWAMRKRTKQSSPAVASSA